MAKTFDVGITLGGRDEFSAVAKKAENALDRLQKTAAGKTRNAFERLNRETLSGLRKTLGGITKTVFSLQGALVGLGIGLAAISFIKTAETMEVYQAQLETTLGSTEKAVERLEWVKKFAATTPFEIEGLVEATVRLEAYGINATNVMRTIGDTAGSMGKDIMLAVEAVADAQTGEFERLKEFGVKAIQDAGKTYFLYTDKHGKEQRALVDRNNRGIITSTLMGIWNERYAGGMEKMSITWRGMMSNLMDYWTQFKDQVMKSGVFEFLKTGLREVLSWINRMKETGQLDVWASEMGKSIVNTLSAVGKVIVRLPEMFNKSMSRIKKIVAFAMQVVSETVLHTAEVILHVMGALVIGKDDIFTRQAEKIKGIRESIDDLTVSALEGAYSNDTAALSWEKFSERAIASIENVRKESEKLTEAQLKDAAAAKEQADRKKGLGQEEPQLASPVITYDADQEIDPKTMEYFEKQMEATRKHQDAIAAIMDEYRFRNLEASGFEHEAKMERLRIQHEQEIEILRQHGASQGQIDQVMAMQRLAVERQFQAQRADAVAKGASAVQQLFPKFKAAALWDAAVNAKGAIIKAWNSAPFPWNLPAVFETSRSVASLLGTMKSIGPGGGGSVGGTSVGGGGTGGSFRSSATGQAKTPVSITIRLPAGSGQLYTEDDVVEILKTALPRAVRETSGQMEDVTLLYERNN